MKRRPWPCPCRLVEQRIDAQHMYKQRKAVLNVSSSRHLRSADIAWRPRDITPVRVDIATLRAAVRLSCGDARAPDAVQPIHRALLCAQPPVAAVRGGGPAAYRAHRCG